MYAQHFVTPRSSSFECSNHPDPSGCPACAMEIPRKKYRPPIRMEWLGAIRLMADRLNSILPSNSGLGKLLVN